MNRLKELRKNAKLTQSQLGELFGYDQTTVSYWEKKGIADTQIAKIVADYFGVTIDYLLGRDNTSTDRNVMPLNIDAVIGVKIPVLGSVPAGIPIEANENIVEYIEIPESWLAGGKQYFGLVVHGDSMYPEYLDGDIIVVRIQEDCESGDDCVVYVNGDYEATFKRVEKLENGYIRLKPLNSAYNPVTYTQQQVIDLPVRIAGIAVELRRKKK